MVAQKSIDLGGRAVVDLVGGALDVVRHGSPIVKGARAAVWYRVGQEQTVLVLAGDVAYGLHEGEVGLSARDESVELTWEVSARDEGVVTSVRVKNVGSRAVEILRLCPLLVSAQDGGTVDLGHSPNTWTFYQQGWQSWSAAFGRHVRDGLFGAPANEEYVQKHVPYPDSTMAETLVSHCFSVLSDRDSRVSLLLGFKTGKDQLAEVQLQADGDRFRRLAAVCHADGLALTPGDSVASERLLVAASDDPLALLELYARSTGEAMGARRSRETYSGWCSWYHFYGENGSEDVLANLDSVSRLGLPLKVILIDDGYQKAIGDWLEADLVKFPRGMKWLAERIRNSGRRPGLWVAPFALSALSRLYAEHPDWVLRAENGQPVVAWHHWAVPVYGLDVSHPEVREWLEKLFLTLYQDWGYDFFKLDFLYAASLAGRRHEPDVSRAQALRLGLGIIRDAVGDSFLLGCGCPLGPAVGLLDGMRIGPDVATYWRHFEKDLSAPAVENAVRNVATRSFMHQRLWTNDPDCVLVRLADQESDLTLNEVRTMATVAALCGGMIMSGDDLVSLHPSRARYLKAILPPYGQSATPLDLFENELPRLLSLRVESSHGRWLILAAINWEDRTVGTAIELDRLGLQDEDYHAYDYWHGRYLGKVRDRLVVGRHQPHETLLLLFKPLSKRPELLTSTFHVTQGGVEVESVNWDEKEDGDQRLVVQLRKEGSQFGQLLFSVPEPYVLVDVHLDGRRRRVNRVAPGVVSIGFRLRDQARVELRFSMRRAVRPGMGPDAKAQKKLEVVHGLLLSEYGHRQWKPHRDPLSELVRTILSQNTSDTNSDRAFARLRERFPTWEEVRDGAREAIYDAIRPGGLARMKAPRIQQALRAISEERGELDLDFLRQMELDEAREWLESLQGVGPKTAACVLLFSLGSPVLPVDTHVYRVSRRLGLVDRAVSPEKAHKVLGEMLPPDATYDFHVNMVSHGRRICRAQRPQCDICILASHCDYYHRGKATEAGPT
jgi:alpha-galactosidase